MSGAELFRLLSLAEGDLRSGLAKLTELRAQLAAMNLPDPSRVVCECGLTLRSEQALAEHRYHSHDGPEPPHWLEAESRSKIEGGRP